MNNPMLSLTLLCAALGGACADNLQIEVTNLKPSARARVLGNDSLNPSFVLSGATLELTLDGTGSSDPDGTIRTYRWASATPQSEFAPAASATDADDAGVTDLSSHRRWVPSGAAPDWPEDIAQPMLTLPAAGNYAFTLWVIDDDGLVSDPSTLNVVVTPPP
jgi:hypothetical protein